MENNHTKMQIAEKRIGEHQNKIRLRASVELG